LGDSIRKYLAAEFPELPQSEPVFSLQQVPPELFGSSIKEIRSIIFLKKGNNKIKYLVDKNASPQLITVIEGKDKNALKELISKKGNDIFQKYYAFEIKNMQERQKITLRDNSDVEKEFGITIDIPDFFILINHKKNFFWLRRDIKNGEEDIILYSVPFIDDIEQLKQRITKYRDSIGRLYIPGPTDSTYMKTTNGISPSQNLVKINGIDAIETRGLWDMKNDFMGGPYLNYAIIDNKNKKIIVAEGFVYAPSLDKRNYMIQLEAILKTIRIKNK